MIINSTAISLIREKKQFQAGIALVTGILKEAEYLDKLHFEELKIINGYSHERRKTSYLLGRLAAKQAICQIYPNKQQKKIWIDTGIFSFPIVRGMNVQNIQVSISHRDKIGFSIAYPESHPMGLDVEHIHEKRKEIILDQLTVYEQNLLKGNAANIVNFTAFFSIKEALSKILRTGMMLDFKFLEIATFQKREQVLECTYTHFGQYKAYAFIKNNYVFSIALPKRTTVELATVWELMNIIVNRA